MTALLIFDQPAEDASSLSTIKGDERVDLLSLTGFAGAIRRWEEDATRGGQKPRRLNAAALIDAQVDGLRRRVHDWAARLGDKHARGKTLKEHFLLPDGHATSWWFSSIAEKNTLKTDVFFKLAQLEAIDGILAREKYDLCLVCLSDGRLSRAVAALGARRGVAVRRVKALDPRHSAKGAMKTFVGKSGILGDVITAAVWLARCAAQGWQARRVLGPVNWPSTVREAVLFVSYFPLIDNQAARDGVFKNRYALPLQELFRRRQQPIIWLLMYSAMDGKSYGEALRLARDFAKGGENIYFLEQFVSFGILCRVLVAWFFQSLTSVLTLQSLGRDALTDGLTLPEARPFLLALWHESFVGWVGMSGLVYYEINKRIFSQAEPLDFCLYYAEIHAWEQALNAARAAFAPHVKTVGYQSGGVSENHFSYFHTPAETTGSRAPLGLPLPNVMAVNGAGPYALMKSSGYPGLEIVEDVRHMYLNPILKNGARRGPHAPRPVVLVAGSIDKNATAGLVSLALEAFPAPREIEVWLKFHPSTNPDDILAHIGLDRWPDGYMLKSGPIQDVLPEVSVLVGGESSVTLDAIAYGCGVVLPVFSDVMFVSPLSGDGPFHKRVYDADQLKVAVADALQRPSTEISSPEARDVVAKYWNVKEDLPTWEKIFTN